MTQLTGDRCCFKPIAKIIIRDPNLSQILYQVYVFYLNCLEVHQTNELAILDQRGLNRYLLFNPSYYEKTN